jgi:hypothetical protein
MPNGLFFLYDLEKGGYTNTIAYLFKKNSGLFKSEKDAIQVPLAAFSRALCHMLLPLRSWSF